MINKIKKIINVLFNTKRNMALYIKQTGKLKEVKEKPFKLEKDIQKVFEANLSRP